MTMSEFIKKNLILVVVLLATFAAACVLIFLCISTHVDIKDSIEKINENNEVVKRKIDKCDPNAVQESVDLIMKDAEEMSEKAS